jgi:ribonuclease P protein subunit POP4
VTEYAAAALIANGATAVAAESTISVKLGANKLVALDNPVKKTKPTHPKKHTKGPGLSAKRRKELGATLVAPDKCKYALYLPLHSLWTQYITHLLNGAGGTGIGERLIKADYHGAILTVVRSTCPSYIGLRGIVLQETENVFRLITLEDEMKTVPKGGNVFAFQHGSHLIQVFGNHIKFKASERAVRKFKAKGNIAL